MTISLRADPSGNFGSILINGTEAIRVNPNGIPASSIGFTPAGNIAASNVQAALQEVDTETQAGLATKVSKSGDTMTGHLYGVTQLTAREGYFGPTDGSQARVVAMANSSVGKIYADDPASPGLARWLDIGTGGGSNRITMKDAVYCDYLVNASAGVNVGSGGAGSLFTAVNAGGIELYAPANTSCVVDFHSNGNTGDYSHRIQADGNGDFKFVGPWGMGIRFNASGIYFGNEGDGGVSSVDILKFAGLNCKEGAAGAKQGNRFNISHSNAQYLWIDSTNVGAFAYQSDYRIKENVVTADFSALDRVNAARVVTYNRKTVEGDIWQGSDEIKEGFIAHELQAIIPAAVSGERDALNSEGGIQPQTLNLDALLATAFKAIQELSAKVTALEAQLAAK